MPDDTTAYLRPHHVWIYRGRSRVWISECRCGWESASARWADVRWLADEHIVTAARNCTN